MSKILDEYGAGDIRKSNKDKFVLKMFALVVLVVIFGVYIGDMLFGKSSLDVLLNLQMQKDELQRDVIKLKSQNAQLQKEYFELKQLDPEIK